MKHFLGESSSSPPRAHGNRGATMPNFEGPQCQTDGRSLGGPGKRKYAAIAALDPDVPFEQLQ